MRPATMSLRLLSSISIALCLSVPCAMAQTVPTGYHVETLASGLASPCAFDFLPDGRVLFTEQNTGFVRLLRTNGVVQPSAVIRVPAVVTGGERGLLGIAVDPRFPAQPYVYCMYSTTGSRTRIARFVLEGDLTGATDGDLLESTTAGRMDIRSNIPDNAPNHNGGTLRFASDGTLIVSIGDDAIPCGAQDSTGNRGVLLRLDVNRLPAGFTPPPVALLTPPDNPYASSPDSNARLVLARGLRNPFRVQCDADQPWIIIGDVGENVREELDLLALPETVTRPPGMALPGANLGWPYLEGTVTGAHASECAPTPSGLSGPVFDYDRTQQNGASIIPVGFVPLLITLAAQPTIPAGLYFSDYYSGALVRLESTANSWQLAPPVAGQPDAARFGEGFREISDWRVRGGELWFVRQATNFAASTGSIGRVVADSLPGPDPRPIGRLTAALDRVPAVAQATIRISDALRFPATLSIVDATGRVRRHFGSGDFGLLAGNYFIFWDGLDDDGGRAPAGVYWARLESAGQTATVRVPFLR